MGENDRPQDVGRRHSRTPSPTSASLEILERYREAMRGELGRLLDELEPVAAVQSSIDGSGDRAIGLGITARKERWDLAIKLGKELAVAPESGPPAAPTEPKRTATNRSAPRLTARERRSIE